MAELKTYYVTFRIADVGDYDHRYETLVEEIRQIAHKVWWTEPTSFILFPSTLSIDEVAAVVAQAMDLRVDIAVVGMPEVKSMRVIGANEDQTIYDLVPFAKKA